MEPAVVTDSDQPTHNDETPIDPAAPPAGALDAGEDAATAAPASPGASSAPIPWRANSAAVTYVLQSFRASGLITWAWITGGVLVAGVLGAIAFTIALSSVLSGIAPDLGQMTSVLLVFLGAAFGGGITADVSVESGLISMVGGGAIAVMPLGSIAVLVLVTSATARWRAQHDRVVAPHLGAEIARAVIEAAGVALFVTLFTAFARFGGGSSFAGIEFRTQSGLVFVTLLSAVSATLFVVRASRHRRVAGTRGGVLLGSVREGTLFLIVQFVGFGLVGLVVLVVLSARAESVAPFFVGLPLLANLAAMGAALGSFGAIWFSNGGFSTTSIGVFDIEGAHGLWLLLVSVVSVVVAAGVVGVRRRRMAAPVWRRVWQLPLVVFAVWCVLALGLAGVSAGGEVLSAVSMSGGISIGMSWWTPVTIAIGAAIASVAAEFVPTLAYRVHPTILVVFGGRRHADAWVRGENVVTSTYSDDVAGAAHDEPEDEADPGSGVFETRDTALPPREPMTPRARRVLIASSAVLGGLVLLTIAAAVTVGLLNQSRDPSAVVSSYLGLIAEGKADEASRVVDPGLRNDERLLLTDEALGAAEQRIEVIEVRTVDRSPSGASVEATISLDGERFEKTFFVAAGPKEFLVLDTWKLEEAMVFPVSVGSDGLTSITVGKADVSLDEVETEYDDYRARTLYAYPGLYVVTAPETEFVTPSVESLRVTPDELAGGVGVSVTADPSEAFAEEVLTQVQEAITKCVQVPTNMDDVCPSVTQQNDLQELKLVVQTEGFEEITLDHFESSEATIAVREGPSWFDDDPDLEESEISVSGTITLEDGKPVISDVSMSSGW
jgi:hypothetical protein